MKKVNYKLLGFFAAVFAIVSVNAISPMNVRAADDDYTVTITDSTSEQASNKVIVTDSADPAHTATFTYGGASTQSVSGASFKISFNTGVNSVAKYNGAYYKDGDAVTPDVTSRSINVGFEPRYKTVTLNGTLQNDGTKYYYLVNNVKVWLTANGTPITDYTKVDKSQEIKLNIDVPVGGGVAYYATNLAGATTYAGTPIVLDGGVTSVTVTTSGGTLPFYITGLSTETQTGSALKLLGGTIYLYQNNSPVSCSSCTGGTATYYLPNYNNLSIYMVPNVVGTSTTSTIVGQVSTDGGINYVNISPNQFYQIPSTARSIAVKFGTGTVTPTSTGADAKVKIYFKGLVGAGISKDLKTVTVPGGKVSMKASSIDQQFGHINLQGETSLTVSSGSKVDITLTPNSGYTAQYKIGNGSFVTGNTISITPTSDQTITIQFVSSTPAKTTTNKDKVPKTGIFHNYVMIFGILAFVVAICVAGVIIYFKKNDKDKEKEKTR